MAVTVPEGSYAHLSNGMDLLQLMLTHLPLSLFMVAALGPVDGVILNKTQRHFAKLDIEPSLLTFLAMDTPASLLTPSIA